MLEQARNPTIKNKHPYGGLLRSHRYFAVDVSVFGGTPSNKPSDCKIRFPGSDAIGVLRRADPTGDKPMLIFNKFDFAPEDIIKTSRFY